jgi:hypothetical protein
MVLVIAVLLVLLGLLGAVLHPVVLVLGLLPADTGGVLDTLNAVKLFVVDFLFWAFIGLAAVAVLVIARGRSASGAHRSRIGEGVPATARLGHPPSIAVAITAYNDAEATRVAVVEFKAQPGVVEVVVIDNNSTDNTAALATAAGARVVREEKQGYGYACMRGLREALGTNADLIVLTEGDGTFVGADLAKFAAYIEEADMVIGTRVVRGLVERDSQMDHFFIWGNIAVSGLLRLRFWDAQFLGAARLSDVGCTYRAIRREALARILPDLTVGGMHFSAHMMLVALERRLTLIEIPIRFRRRIGESKGAGRSLLGGIRIGLAMVWHILSYRPRHLAST